MDRKQFTFRKYEEKILEEMTGHQLPEMFQVCHEKERIEGQLAKNIYAVFNGGEPLRRLQQLAGAILIVMGGGSTFAFDAAVKEEGNLRVWDKVPKTKSVFKVYGASPLYLKKLDASDVADLIRLAGEWVEQGGGRAEKLQEAKKAYRGGVGGNPQNVWKSHDKSGKKIAEQKLKGIPGAQETKGARWRYEGWQIEPQLKEFMRDPAAKFSGMGGKKEDGRYDKYSKRLVSGSNLSIIDRLFGLSWGCDISGTTCDQVFAMDRWGPGILGHPAYAMLPLGAIVHNWHHTLLEVALPLSINDRIAYRIGFFDTLIPPQGLPAELNAINGAIQQANKDMSGKHLLRYYTNQRPAGCFRFLPQEIEQLKRADIFHAESVLQLVSTGRVSVFPGRSEVLGLIERYFN